MKQKTFAIQLLPKIKNLLTSNKYKFKQTATYTDGLDTTLEEYGKESHKILLHSNTYAEEVNISGDIHLLQKDLENIK